MTMLSRIAMSLGVAVVAIAGCATNGGGGGWVTLLDGEKGIEISTASVMPTGVPKAAPSSPTTARAGIW